MHKSEAKILELLVRVEAVKAELAGMQVHDAHAQSVGAGVYDESAYNGMARQLEAYADEISLYGKGLPVLNEASYVNVRIVGQEMPVRVQTW